MKIVQLDKDERKVENFTIKINGNFNAYLLVVEVFKLGNWDMGYRIISRR